MLPIPVNNSPDLMMFEITKKLFNNKFLSDIQFSVGDQIIYAHSLELMKRSLVFEQQLESTWNEKKLIPIDTVKYESFFEFIRFIYTDECNVDDTNGFDLLKLAITYKVIKLENKMIDYLYRGDVSIYLRFLEFSIEEGYTLMLDGILASIATNFKNVLAEPTFATIQPKALETILQFDHVECGVNEIEIFNGLLRWINRYCADNDLILSEHKQEFQKYTNLIRFSAMTDQQIYECVHQNPDLFSDNEFASFYKKMIQANTTDMENAQKRKHYRPRMQCLPFGEMPTFTTKFIVSERLILTGIIFGGNFEKPKLKIGISSSTTDIGDGYQFLIVLQNNCGSCCVSLGESIQLEPGVQYVVNVTVLPIKHCNDYGEISCRRQNVKVRLADDISEFVHILQSGRNLIEMFFKTL